MKLVIYGHDNAVIDVIKGVTNPVIDGNNVTWEGGSINGINLPFCLLEDEVAVTTVTDEVVAADKKGEFNKVDLAKENADLKARLELMQSAVDDLILGGM
jgi:hypothetical protein